MGPIGIPEMVFIFVLALLIFGPRKLPELGRMLGKAMTEFRRASSEVRLAIEDEMREMDRQTREVTQEAEAAVAEATTLPEEPAGSGTLDPSLAAAPATPEAGKADDGDRQPA